MTEPIGRRVATVKELCAAQGTPFRELAFDEGFSRLARRNLSGAELWDIRVPYVYCGQLQDVHFFGRSFIHTKDGAFVFLCQSYQNHQAFAFEECAAAYIDTRDDLFTSYFEDECIFLGGMNVEPTPQGSSHLLPGAANFGHFIFEYLNRLCIFDVCGLLNRLPVVIYDTLPRKWDEWFALIGVDPARLIRVPLERSPAFRKAWVSSPCHYRDSHDNPRMWGGGLHWLRYQAFKSIGGPQIGARRRIYLGRGDAAWRRVTNEAEVVTMLQRYGFEYLHMHQMSARAQVEAISGAELVVAAAGANTILTHFAPEHCITIAMFPHPTQGRGLWGGLGASIYLRQVYERIDGTYTDAPTPDPASPAHAFERANYSVNVEELETRVRGALDVIAQNQIRDAGRL